MGTNYAHHFADWLHFVIVTIYGFPVLKGLSLYTQNKQMQLNKAETCDFQQCGILTSVDSDEPVQSPVKLRHSK